MEEFLEPTSLKHNLEYLPNTCINKYIIFDFSETFLDLFGLNLAKKLISQKTWVENSQLEAETNLFRRN